MDLRPYQNEAEGAVHRGLEEYSRILYVMATGTGKTVTFASIIQTIRERDPFATFLILAHRSDIITQAYKTVMSLCGLNMWEIGIEQADRRASTSAWVVCGSIDTVVKPNRLDGLPITHIIYDEAHRSACNTAKRIFAKFPNAKVIGCTATPKRSDKKSLYYRDTDNSVVWLREKSGKTREAEADDCVFEKLVYSYPYGQAISEGFLVDFKIHNVDTGLSLDGLKESMSAEAGKRT